MIIDLQGGCGSWFLPAELHTQWREKLFLTSFMILVVASHRLFLILHPFVAFLIVT